MAKQSIAFLNTVWVWSKKRFQQHFSAIMSLFLSVLSLLFFLTISYPELFTDIGFFRQRYFSIIILGLAVVTSYAAAFHNHWKWTIRRALPAWVHTNILTLYSLAYYIRLNNIPFDVFGFQLTTGVVFIPLTILIFLVNFEIFSEDRNKPYLIIPQTILFLLLTFSFINFLLIDNSASRDIGNEFLRIIIDWPAWLWLVVSASVISWISLRRLPNVTFRVSSLFTILFSVLLIQIMIGVYLMPISYWYQTLLALVTWNFLYYPVAAIMRKAPDSKYRAKLTVSTAYHAFLFLIILIVS